MTNVIVFVIAAMTSYDTDYDTDYDNYDKKGMTNSL